jgi:uncharacterized protein (DUF2235 family)
MPVNNKKRIAIFLDGTWNEPGDNTNVWRMKLMVADRGPDEIEQRTYYDTGVGTKWYERFRGGAFATGLSKNVREAYQWLMEHYNDGDEVFVFGFSRGAYTARSLTGMIAKCGLLQPGAPMPVIQVFERYARGQEATPLWTLEFQKKYKGRTDFSLEEKWLLEYSTRIDIQFIGVWDTVGTLGIPIGNIKGISRRSMYYHHTRLSKIFKNTFQVLAIDEHRKPYRPSLWSKFIPKPKDGEGPVVEADADPEQDDPHIEQRWFAGAHSNIGGGYRNDPVAQVPLAWLQQKAKEAGLHFSHEIELDGTEHLFPLVDSFKQFLKGFYRILRLGKRYYRTIGLPREEKETGWVETVDETIDETVFDRWRENSKYRPKNVAEWAKKKGVDPATMHETTPA